MKTRLLAAAFVACCLLLCGLILRRQIAAHPLMPEAARSIEDGSDGRGRYGGDRGWHPASPLLSALAHQAVAGQLSALKAGDGPKAWEYQSRGLRQNFSSPALFMQVISRYYPVFARYRQVQYGPTLADTSGQQVRALILLQGENGTQVRAVYLLVREGGEFKVSGVQVFPWPEGQR